MTKTITVSVYGGLGNQMFQYAVGTALAQRLGARLVLDLAWFDNAKPPGVTAWPFALERFPATEFSVSREGSDLFKDNSRLRNIAAKILGKLRRKLTGRTLYVERHFAYDPALLDLPAGAWILGYWQSPKYFESLGECLRDQFGRAELSKASESMRDAIAATNAVCPHVRRGDYLGTVIHPVCDVDYYRRGIQFFLDNLDDPHFFIFSDDPEWARKNVHTAPAPSTVVDINSSDQAHQDLVLMAKCKHFVIANSTFSWWAAWLSSHSRKIVIAPAKWFATEKLDVKDLIPADWRRF